MNLPKRVVLIFVFISLAFVSNVYGKGKINFELQLKPSWQYVEVDKNSEVINGYLAKPLSYGASLVLLTKKIQYRISFDRFSWNRNFVGQMQGVPSPPSPVEEIHESVTSNTFFFNISYKWTNISKTFIPYLGCGTKINFLASEEIGQTTHLHFTADNFWYPGVSILGGVVLPIAHQIAIFTEIDYCTIGSSSFIQACDGYRPAYLLEVSSISLGIGYRFQVSLQ